MPTRRKEPIMANEPASERWAVQKLRRMCPPRVAFNSKNKDPDCLNKAPPFVPFVFSSQVSRKYNGETASDAMVDRATRKCVVDAFPPCE